MKILKKIDIYIIKKFLGTYFFAIALILAITVMFDINEKLDSFLKAPLSATIFDYFFNFLPYFANLFSPLFTFIAVIFFTSKLADNSAVIAMLSSGISFKRLFVPYMVSAAIIAALNLYLSCYVIPPANVTRIEYMNTYGHTLAILYGFSKSVDRVSSQQHRKGHVLPDAGRYALQWAGGRERNPVCLLPCHSHCRSPVPQLYDGQAFSE